MLVCYHDNNHQVRRQLHVCKVKYSNLTILSLQIVYLTHTRHQVMQSGLLRQPKTTPK